MSQTLAPEAAALSQCAHVKDLVDYNVTLDETEKLATGVASFDYLFESSQLCLDAGKSKEVFAALMLTGFNPLFKSAPRIGLAILKDTNCDAYNLMRKANKVDNISHLKANQAKGTQSMRSLTGLPPTLALLLGLLFLPLIGRSQSEIAIPYATPTKQLTLSVTYSLVVQKTYSKYQAAQAEVPATKKPVKPAVAAKGAVPAKLKITKLLNAVIENNSDITVLSTVRADPSSRFMLKLPVSTGGKRSVKYVFEDSNPLLLQGINTDYTPMTVEVIGGVTSLLGSALSIASKVIPFASIAKASLATDSVVIEKVKFTTQRNVTPISANPGSITRASVTNTLKLSDFLSMGGLGSLVLPEVLVRAEPDAVNFSGEATLPKVNPTGDDVLYYRNPAYYTIIVSVTNNGSISNQTVSIGRVSIPQFGTWEKIPLATAFTKGKKSIAIKLDNTSGGLKEYSYAREGTLGAALSAGAAGLDKVGEGVDKIKAAKTTQLELETKQIQAQTNYLKALKERKDTEAAADKADN